MSDVRAIAFDATDQKNDNTEEKVDPVTAESLFEASDEPSPRLTVVEIPGERWSGKTSLLNQLTRDAAAHGWRTASGHATTTLSAVPYGIFVDALDDLLVRFDTDALTGPARHHVARLAGVFPALAAAAPPITETPSDRYHALRALHALLEALAAEQPLLITLDDGHRADSASLDLLSHLLGHPPAGRIVLAIAHRPRQGDGMLRSLLAEAAAHGRLRRSPTVPLSEEQALSLLPDDLSRVHCETLLAEADGNPGLLRAFAALRAVPDHCGSTAFPLPIEVLTDCLRDFRGLTPAGWLAARSAAVLGEPFDVAALGRVAQLDGAALRAALDELLREDLVHGTALARGLRFRNPLLRAAAYQSAGSGWLQGAHERATALLAPRDSASVPLARHLEHSAVEGDAAGAGVLLTAAAERLWQDPVQAAAWTRTAMDLDADSGRTARTRLLLGRALALTGRLRESLAALTTTTAVPGAQAPGAPDTSAAAHRCRARIWRLLGDHGAALAELDAASRLPGARETRARARLLGERLAHALETGEGAGVADGAVTEPPLGDLPLAERGRLLALLAASAVRSGAGDRAREYADRAAPLLDALPDGVAVRHLDGLYWLAATESALGRAEAASLHFGRSLRIAEARRLTGVVPQLAMAMARLQLEAGDLAGAVRHAACAETNAAAVDSPYLLGLALELKSEVAAALRGNRTPSPAPVLTPVEAEPGLAALSKRELEIAVLVSGGRTNQQIARALELSHKTVETHLGRIFRKLDVSSRAEVAAVVGRSERKGQGPHHATARPAAHQEKPRHYKATAPGLTYEHRSLQPQVAW
ncbi:AAA family ATPase [Streptomyces sp. NPDC056222]|uniref:AAA family ATPase n=1 Tax=Streptomyces sp. NPDC056222 TaxID=3345749 RepID=UPI0035DE9A54